MINSKKVLCVLFVLCVLIVGSVFATDASETVQEPEKGVVMFLVAETKEADKEAERAALKAARDAAKAEREAAKAAKKAEQESESSSFLDKCSASVYFSPFSFRGYAFEDHSKTITSKYGIGERIKGRYFISNGFYAAVDIGATTAFMRKWQSGNITDVVFLAKGGYKYDFGNEEQFYAFGEFGCGLTITAGNGVGRAYFLLALELGAGYKFNDNWSVETSCEGTWHHADGYKGLSAHSAWGVNTFLGATYKF